MVHKGFKTIKEKGGLPIHLMSLGIEPEYFYHLDDMKTAEGKPVKNTFIQTMLLGEYEHKFSRTTIAGWRKKRKEEQDAGA